MLKIDSYLPSFVRTLQFQSPINFGKLFKTAIEYSPTPNLSPRSFKMIVGLSIVAAYVIYRLVQNYFPSTPKPPNNKPLPKDPTLKPVVTEPPVDEPLKQSNVNSSSTGVDSTLSQTNSKPLPKTPPLSEKRFHGSNKEIHEEATENPQETSNSGSSKPEPPPKPNEFKGASVDDLLQKANDPLTGQKHSYDPASMF